MARDVLSIPDDGRRPITDARVLSALQAVDRRDFVPEDLRHRAFEDGPLPIGHGQTISQPYIVGIMVELLGCFDGARVLEIGAGCGWQAAVLAQLGCVVHTLERIEPLARSARQRMADLGVHGVQVHHADGHDGWTAGAPYDGIVLACTCDAVPRPLEAQLKIGGRIVAPVRTGGGEQLIVHERVREGDARQRDIMAVRFVPMRRG